MGPERGSEHYYRAINILNKALDGGYSWKITQSKEDPTEAALAVGSAIKTILEVKGTTLQEDHDDKVFISTYDYDIDNLSNTHGVRTTPENIEARLNLNNSEYLIKIPATKDGHISFTRYFGTRNEEIVNKEMIMKDKTNKAVYFILLHEVAKYLNTIGYLDSNTPFEDFINTINDPFFDDE